jgi:hypothetical protein
VLGVVVLGVVVLGAVDDLAVLELEQVLVDVVELHPVIESGLTGEFRSHPVTFSGDANELELDRLSET